MKRFTGGLLVAALAAGSLLASTPASAISPTPKAESVSARPSATVKPPVLSKAWYRCSTDGAGVAVDLYNPNQIELSYQLQIFAGDVQEAQVATLAPRTAEVLEFGGIPNGRYQILILNADGDVVARTRGRVKCPATETCQATALPTLGHQRTEVVDGDPTGRYLVASASTFEESDYVYSVLVWVRGRPRLLDTEPLQPYVEIRPTGVNRHGAISGYRHEVPTAFQDPWLFRNGKFTILPELTPDDGTVLGILGGIPGGTPYIWPPRGKPYPLSVPPGFNLEDTNVAAIRNGWVAGYGQQGNRLVGLRWNLRRHTVETTSADHPLGLSVNRHGTIGAVGALIHRDGRTVPLGDDARPVVVTDRGTAAGNTTQFGGQPVVWTGC